MCLMGDVCCVNLAIHVDLNHRVNFIQSLHNVQNLNSGYYLIPAANLIPNNNQIQNMQNSISISNLDPTPKDVHNENPSTGLETTLKSLKYAETSNLVHHSPNYEKGFQCRRHSSKLKPHSFSGNKATGKLPWSFVVEENRFKDQPSRYLCSASLIHPKAALTAAHCVEEYTINPNGISVRAEMLDPNQNNGIPSVLHVSTLLFDEKSFELHNHKFAYYSGCYIFKTDATRWL